MPEDTQWNTAADSPEGEDARLELEMRNALRRVDAPDGFTNRLMARAAQVPVTRKRAGARTRLARWTTPAWRMAYAAAALLAITAGAAHTEHVRAEQRKADAAAAQFDTALQVTQRALDQVGAKLETTEFGAVQRALNAGGGDQ